MGAVGIRLFGNLSKLNIISMKSGPVGSIPVIDSSAEYRELKEKWRNQLVSKEYDSIQLSACRLRPKKSPMKQQNSIKR